MALMERVATLLRANINDLIDRAEDPEKMLKQIVLDMENQLLQLKTQVAMALADQHLLAKKQREQEETAAGWHRKAELAVNKGDDALARAALERALNHERLQAAFAAQVGEGSAESEALRCTYTKLQGKLAETQAQCELLIAQHRRARMISKATEARTAFESDTPGAPQARVVSRMQARIEAQQAGNYAAQALLPEASLEDRFAALEQGDRVEQLLQELKTRESRNKELTTKESHMLAAG